MSNLQILGEMHGSLILSKYIYTLLEVELGLVVVMYHREDNDENLVRVTLMFLFRCMLCKFDGKADEGFFVGYSLNSKAFRLFNSRTRIVEENLHIRFSKSTPNVVGSGSDWLFDIDTLTGIMNYEPFVARTQSNGFAGTKVSDNVGQARKETKPVKNYILLPLWTVDPPYSQDPKSSHNDGSDFMTLTFEEDIDSEVRKLCKLSFLDFFKSWSVSMCLSTDSLSMNNIVFSKLSAINGFDMSLP
ncbi:hypothetical protein Tco_0790911 [Tanacetum coccineum]